jgi:hypothetical protein
MDLVQVDVLKRVIYTSNPSGYYYWTSVLYIDADLFTSYFNLQNYVLPREQLICTNDVQFMGIRIHNPPGRGNVVYEEDFSGLFRGLIASEGEYSLINIARWRLYSDTGRASYRLNRMPLRPSDQDGQLLSDSGYLVQQASLNALLAPARFRNSYGELLVSGEVVRPLVKWQLRHGTKRRERNPLA